MRVKGKLFLTTAFAALLGVATFAGVSSAKEASKAEAAVSKTVTRVYIEDQVNSNTTLLAIESISFASGYNHTTWRDFLTSYLGARSSYNTTSGSTQPSTKGWSYMSNSEQEKYLLCPSGSKNFTMVFPEWVTALSYKAVGNNFWNWFDVNGSAVGLHSGWGIGKKVNSYIYNSGGWTMNASLDNTAQTNTWGDVTITAIAAFNSSEVERKSITMSKYYLMSSQSYGSIFGYTASGWYTNIACTSSRTSLITANSTVYTKLTLVKESYLAGTMNSWNASDDNYLMSPAENSQYTIDTTFTKDTEFKVVYKGDWYGWNQVDQSSPVIINGSIVQGSDPDSTGYRIKVAVAGKYEIYFKTTAGSNRIWIQQDSSTEASAYAAKFLAAITCTSSSTTFNINVWNNVSGTGSMEYKFSQLTEGAKGLLKTASPLEGGTVIEQCAARYDRILSKYGYGTASGQYHDFMERTPAVSSGGAIIKATIGGTSSTIIIVAISSVCLAAVGGYFLFRKKKDN